MGCELRAYAVATGRARPASGNAMFRAQVLHGVLSALQVADAAARQDAMVATFTSGGSLCGSVYNLCFPPMPGL